MASLGEEAQRYASAGYPVFPCRLDKRPLTEHGFQEATTDSHQIEAWWEQWPDASIGIPTGKAIGMWVLDIDPAKGGGESLLKWEELGQLPDTVHAQTGGGGSHLFFRLNGEDVRNSQGDLAPGIDVRGTGGYVIAAPSNHAKGSYQWISSFFEQEPVEAPPWLMRIVREGTKKRTAVSLSVDTPIVEGQRNGMLLSLGGTMRRRGLSPDAILAALQKENETRCQPPLDASEVAAIVQSLLRYPAGESLPTPTKIEEKKAAPIVTLRPYAEIEPKHVSWLWYPYIPLGRLTSIEGNPGDGKSWFALAVAAQLSHGYWHLQMAGEASVRTPSVTLYLSCEDNPHDTLRPRLDILGGELTKIFHIEAKNKDGQFVLLTLDDLPSLRHAIVSSGAQLLLIDPVQAYLPRGTDMNKAEHMRPVLAALNALAEETGCAIVLVRHFGKAMREVTLHKAIGSVDFAAAVRSILVVGRDQREEVPVGESHHVVLQIKNNVAQKGLPLGFTLRPNEFTWTASTMTEEEFGRTPTEEKEEAGPRAEAKEFLQAQLADGPCKTKDIKSLNSDRGASWRTVQRAKRDLGIIEFQVEKVSWWKLPESL